ncbi:MAG TPA: ABC transporter permease [Chloroflexia bacterium]|nr:ABC transporter permease [Chloroflexia bacterium]
MVSGGALATASAVGVAFLSLPLLALLLRVPLASLASYLATPLVRDALRLSALSSLASLALMVGFGTPLAYLLGRRTFRGKALLETVLELPLILPPAVAGVALLFAFGRRTPLGTLLHSWQLDVAFTLAAVVLAQTFVAAPFYIKSARAGFQGVPRELLDAAATQGASGWATFRHVVVPLAAPSLAGGAILGWARAVGEFGATILFAGNFPGRTQTMPLAIYTALESDVNAAIVLAAILVLTSFTVLLVFKLVSGGRLEVSPE